MDLQMFDEFRPDTWQENGGMLIVFGMSRSTRWRILRRAERFFASAAAATLLTVAVSNGPVHFDVMLSPANTVGFIRSTPLYSTDAQFTMDGDVLPQLWGRLMAYTDTWPDLPPEEEGPSSEPFV
jgi:hypothetical protein